MFYYWIRSSDFVTYPKFLDNSTHAKSLSGITHLMRKSIQYYSILFHNIETIMSDIDKSNNDDNGREEEYAIAAMEARRIITLLQNQVRQAECECVVQISKVEILEPESCERMRCDWIYGIISKEEDICPITGSITYQVNWAYAHLPCGNSFLAFVAPVWEHDFNVVKFPEDDNDEEDMEIRRQFIKLNGEWLQRMLILCLEPPI